MNCSRIKPILTTVFSLFCVYTVYAQTATIQGRVSDALTKETIIGGSIKLPGTNRGISTQADGSYVLREVAPGIYSVEISYIGYKTLLIEGVTADAGRTVTINAELHPSGDELEEVVVTARVNREGQLALLTERRKSAMVVQKIGSQELNRKGIGNVGEGLTKMVGVSMVGSKDLFVRGLGDRYNNATLNGLPIPSTNPDVKLIPLDIFPTSVVQNITVVKSYSPSFYGDFSGGTVDIVTKDYPEDAFFKASVSFGGNNMATGQQFLQNDRSFAEKLGFIRSSRRLPSVVANAEQYDSHTVGNDTDPGFNTPWSPGTSSAPVNGGISLSGGNGYKFDSGQRLGFLVNVAYKNEYSFEEGISALYNAQKTPGYLYDTESFMYKTNLSGLVSSTYKPSSESDYTVTGLFVNSSSDVAFVNSGFYSDIEDPIMGRRNTALQNTLYSGQLSSRLQLTDEQTLRWALGYTKTVGTMPDRTQNLFRSNGNGNYSFVVNSDSDNHKFFSELEDQEVAAKIEFTVENNFLPALQQMLVGMNGKYKDRAFDARQFDARLKALGSAVNIDRVDQVLNPDLLGDASSQGTWRYAELFYGPNHYRANLAIIAPFVDFSFLWNEKWSLTAGVRVEASRQNTHYKTAAQGINDPYRLLTLDGADVLPAATLKYLVNASSNVLLSLSRTISRPLFVESAPFRYNNAAATAEREGNPHLVNGSNYNFDLKYEIYPSNAEIIAFSVFGKYLRNPIELMQKVSASPIFTFVNTKEAVLAGAELEISRNAASLFASESAVLKNLSLGANASYLYTRIKMDDAQIQQLLKEGIPIAPTNRERPLFGASPYLINADLSYRANWSSRSHTVFTSTYNVFGKRLFVAGSQNAGDIYELPVNSLDFSINSVINKRIGFDISVGNALDQKARFHQEYTDANLEFSSLRRGVTIGASVSYSF